MKIEREEDECGGGENALALEEEVKKDSPKLEEVIEMSPYIVEIHSIKEKLILLLPTD
jgi:hypothetical protein